MPFRSFPKHPGPGLHQVRPSLDVNFVSALVLTGNVDVVSYLALDGYVGDEPLHSFRVYSRQVSGIRVSVGISVLDIEKKNKVVPAVHVDVRLYWSRHLWSSSSMIERSASGMGPCYYRTAVSFNGLFFRAASRARIPSRARS